MQPKAPDISVVIPALNERENLELLLPLLNDVILSLNLEFEIIIADGGSLDGSAEFARQAGAHVVTQSERGYGGLYWPVSPLQKRLTW